MLVRDGEVNVGLTIGACIHGSLYEMLLHWCARAVLVVVEKQQSLRQLAVVETFGSKHVSCYCLIVALGKKSLDVLTLILLALVTQFLAEGEVANTLEIAFLEVCCRHVIVCIYECKHILEHTAGSSRCRNELHDSVTLILVILPCLYICLSLLAVGSDNSFLHTCRSLKLQERKSLGNLLQLLSNLLLGDTASGNLLQITFCKHNIHSIFMVNLQQI